MSSHDPENQPLDDLEQSRTQPGTGAAAGENVAADVAAEAHAAVSSTEADAFGRGEGVIEAKEVEGLSQGQIVLRRFTRHKGALAGMIVLGTVALLAITSMGIGPIPGWWKFQDFLGSGTVQNGGAPTLHLPRWLGGPGFAIGDHPFGQDEIGRDNFAQVMKGVQTSLFVMTVMGIVQLIIGVTIGALSGYYRGRLDMVLMRFTDMVITLPVIVIGAVLGKLVYTIPTKLNASDALVNTIHKYLPLELAIALGCILWPGMARLVRSEFMSLREREFVDSARVAGASDWRIITKHMLPNAMGVIIVNVTLLMSAAVVLETALSYLGFGIAQPNISLGNLISANQGAFATRPWLFWWPGLFIILIALCVNFIGDGLRDAFDPRQKRIPSQRQMDKAQLKDDRGLVIETVKEEAK